MFMHQSWHLVAPSTTQSAEAAQPRPQIYIAGAKRASDSTQANRKGPDTFNFELLIFAMIKRNWDFCFGIEVVKNSAGGLCILYCSYRGGSALRVSTVQNTQAHSEFLTTSIPKQKPRLHKNYLDPLVNKPPCLTFRCK